MSTSLLLPQSPSPSPSPSQSIILLLDGGTSTHLESIIQARRCRQVKSQSTKTDTDTDTNTDLFPDRNLWSSSLLLTDQGRQDIQQCHLDFYNAGSDIVTTVTYQLSHHVCQCHSSHEHDSCKEGVVDGNGNGNDLARVYKETEIDDMLKEAIQLAKTVATAKIKNPQSSEEDQDPHHSKQRFVVASVGCYGAVLADGSEYTGSYGKVMSMSCRCPCSN